MGNQDTKTGGKRKTVIEPNARESIIINPRFSEGGQGAFSIKHKFANDRRNRHHWLKDNPHIPRGPEQPPSDHHQK